MMRESNLKIKSLKSLLQSLSGINAMNSGAMRFLEGILLTIFQKEKKQICGYPMTCSAYRKQSQDLLGGKIK